MRPNLPSQILHDRAIDQMQQAVQFALKSEHYSGQPLLKGPSLHYLI